MPSSTTPRTPALLIEAHPVLRRLTGQVIWLMFEEAAAEPDDIQAFLDGYEKTKVETLPFIAAALDPEHSPLVRIETDDDAPEPCRQCAALKGKLLRLDGPDALAWLPPYSLGCRAYAVETDAPNDAEQTLDRNATPPTGRLICGEWIFAHPWSENAKG